MRINLLPRELQPQPLMNPARIMQIIIAIVLIAAAFSGMVYEYFQLKTAESSLQEVTQQASSYQSRLLEVQITAQKRQQLADENAKFIKLNSYYSAYPDLLNQLAASSPDKVWLTEADFPAPGGTIAINGRTLRFSLVGDFLTNLKKAAAFKTVPLSQIKKTALDKVTCFDFTIQITTTEGGILEYAKDQN
jgi:Tfp pilus assembly protein PilN